MGEGGVRYMSCDGVLVAKPLGIGSQCFVGGYPLLFCAVVV